MRSGAPGRSSVVLQSVEGPGPGVVVGGPLEPVPGELLPGVAGDHLQQGLLVASLRNPYLHPGAARAVGVDAALHPVRAGLPTTRHRPTADG